MNKQELIARCLVEAKMIDDISTAKNTVESIFAEYYPSYSFREWNTDLYDEAINYYIKMSRTASSIRVDSFIRDLWDL